MKAFWDKVKNSPHKKFKIIWFSLVTLLFLGASTGLNFLFAHLKFPEANIVLIYLLCVILVTSFTDGFVYGIVAGVLSIFAFNIFFAQPYYSISVYDSGYVVTFV